MNTGETRSNLLVFQAILEFLTDLKDYFNDKHHSILLYQRLLSKIDVSDKKQQRKHVHLFKDFCVTNRESINTKNVQGFVSSKVKFSEKIYVDIPLILSQVDSDTKKVIWQHLLTISAMVDPASKAKQLLSTITPSGGGNNFIGEMMELVMGKFQDADTSNPMQMMVQMMSSGVMTDMVSKLQEGMQSGQIDIPQMIGGMQQMVGNVQNEFKDPMISGMLNMLQTTTSQLVQPQDEPVVVEDVENVENVENVEKN